MSCSRLEPAQSLEGVEEREAEEGDEGSGRGPPDVGPAAQRATGTMASSASHCRR